MNRVNEKDIRPIVINEVGQSQVSVPLTDADRDSLIVAIAIKLGVINERTFRCPQDDMSCDDRMRADVMKSLYNKVFDSKSSEWVTVAEKSE